MSIIRIGKAQRQNIDNSKADFVSLVAKYNCFERDSNVSFLKVWHMVSEHAFKNDRTYRKEIYTGSLNEGLPSSVCNDIDIMFALPHWPQVLMEPPPNPIRQGYVIQVSDTKYPAFLTLRVPPGVEYMAISPYNNDQDIRDAFVNLDDSGRKKILSSAKMLEMNGSLGRRGTGPALTEWANTSLPSKGEVDYVACLECPNWPSCASEFLTRDRPHGWPSQHLDKIRKLGCHVVAVGRHDSPQKYAEWSWAFTMAEKELTYDVSDSIYICMYLLRAIKNKHWLIEKQPGEPTIFSSYLIKTACYWMCEEIPENTEDILGLVEKIIDWLITCFRNKKMPHYILPEANLIGRLKEDKKHFEQAMEWLEDVRDNLVDKIHTSIEFDENIEAVRNILLHLKRSPNIPIPEDMMREVESGSRRDGEAYSRRERHALAKLATDFCFEVQDKIEDHIKELVNIKWLSKLLSWQHTLYFLWKISSFAGRNMMNARINDAIHTVEKIFEPVQENVTSLVKPEYQRLANAFVYREMGDVFHILYCILTNCNAAPNDPNESEIYKSAIKYYNKGSGMYYKNGWNDKGLMLAVHLSFHYYVFQQWAELQDTLTKLEPLLKEAKDCEDTLKSLPYVRVGPDTPMAKAGRHNRHVAIWARSTFHRHPVFIGFHLLELMAEKEGNTKEAKEYRKYKEQVDQDVASWE